MGGGRRFLQNDEREVFIENIDRDEIRSGFLVTSQRKKLWNVQIGLINEVARICKKHNIRWFAGYGTLLGAARHKGFIPWDDDVDLIMFRPDYDKFQRVAATEIQSPYFLDNWYNYRFESEGASLTDPEGDFQFITEDQQKDNACYTYMPSLKVRDSRTSMIEYPNRKYVNQGIWIDIFSLDPVPPFTQEKQNVYFEIAKTFLSAIIFPQKFRKAIQDNEQFIITPDKLKEFIALPYKKRGEIFEEFLRDNFFVSECLSNFHTLSYCHSSKPFSPDFFSDVIYLPFEKIEVPAPADYDKVLQADYGDWRTPVYNKPHIQIYSADIPWREYFQKTAFK